MSNATSSPTEARGALRVAGVSQRFGTTRALRGIDLEVEAGEFLGLLGPSGCGKSTLLRILAGFLRPTTGAVFLDGEEITTAPAEKRPLNMVFQRPSLFPHLDVFENVAFGLRVGRTPRGEIEQRVVEALEMVRLGRLIRRRAYQLSGGQMQRVALARALVNRPQILLLDEPLSALDLKIRLEMEAELRRLHTLTGATFVYVTHDQGEALSMAARVAVFSEGEIAQIGTPDEIYTKPASSYVARFVGDANVLPVEIRSTSAQRATLSLAGAEIGAPRERGLEPGPAQLVVRAESIGFRRGGEGVLSGTVVDRAYGGRQSSYLVDVSGLPRPVRVEIRGVDGEGSEPDVGNFVSLGWEEDAGWLIEAEAAARVPDKEVAR